MTDTTSGLEPMPALPSVQDRAAGRTMVNLYLERDTEEASAVAEAWYAWADLQGAADAHLRGLERTRMTLRRSPRTRFSVTGSNEPGTSVGEVGST